MQSILLNTFSNLSFLESTQFLLEIMLLYFFVLFVFEIKSLLKFLVSLSQGKNYWKEFNLKLQEKNEELLRKHHAEMVSFIRMIRFFILSCITLGIIITIQYI